MEAQKEAAKPIYYKTKAFKPIKKTMIGID